MSLLDRYDDTDFAKIKTAKQLARFIKTLLEYDGERPYGEILDCIDAVCTYVKRNKNIKTKHQGGTR